MIGVAAVWLCGGLCKVGGPASWGSGAWVSFGGWRSVEELYRVMTRGKRRQRVRGRCFYLTLKDARGLSLLK